MTLSRSHGGSMQVDQGCLFSIFAATAQSAVLRGNLSRSPIFKTSSNAMDIWTSKRLSAVLASSHAVIVPTTSRFEEGFNMVCAEAIFAGRPVITSPVCPALEYVREAAVQVPPDNIEKYCQAILKLYDDQEFYEQKQARVR